MTREPEAVTQVRIDQVRAIFVRGPVTEVGALWYWAYPDFLSIDICVDKTQAIGLRFDDMPTIARILGTEHLNFGFERGSYICDSFTFDGHNVLHITALYGKV